MRKLILLMLFALPLMASAQIAVMDVSPDKKVFQVKNIANQVKQLAESARQNETLVNTFQTAMKTKQDINDMLKLHNEVQRALLTVRNIKDLTWSDMTNVFNRSAGVSFDYASLVPRSSDGDASRIFTKGSGFGSGATSLYYKASGRMPANTNEKVDSRDLALRNQKAYKTQLSLDDATSVRKLQVASYYDDMAEDLAKKSLQLSAAINAEGKLSMTSAERLSLHKSSRDAMFESVDLRIKADELRQASLIKTPVQVEQSRRESLKLMREELAVIERRTNGFLSK